MNRSSSPSQSRNFVLLFAFVGLLIVAAASASAAPAGQTGKYIVVFANSVEHPGDLAHAQVAQHDGKINAYFRSALDGYAATLPKDQIAQLQRDPDVKYVTVDQKISASEQTIPTGVQRIYASTNKHLSIDGLDNLQHADVDVAVIDSGIDFENPDLKVEGRTNCLTGTCIDNTGVDDFSHGTHVAGTIAAIDNGTGVVGVAPGARLWAVKTLDNEGNSTESVAIKGVEWVTERSNKIEVANMSSGCTYCTMPALETAINKAIEAGVVFVVSAGNEHENVSYASPAKDPNVITVSAATDYDGKPGGKGFAPPECGSQGPDDVSAPYSNWGAGVDVAAPGTCILSTLPGGSPPGFKTGTSMAAPQVAGAAAILASEINPGSKADVEAIRNSIVAAGNLNWTDTSPDGIKEPLLDLSNESTFTLIAPLPQNTVRPVVTPTNPEEAATVVSTNTGTWTNNPYYSYQWQRCNGAGAECVNIAGATVPTYTPVKADVGKALVSSITATNSGGSISASSKPTSLVLASKATLYKNASKTTGIVPVGETFTATMPKLKLEPLDPTTLWVQKGGLPANNECAEASINFKVTQNSGVFKAVPTAVTFPTAWCSPFPQTGQFYSLLPLEVSGNSISAGTNTDWLSTKLNFGWYISGVGEFQGAPFSKATGNPPTKGAYIQQPTAAKAPISIVLDQAGLSKPTGASVTAKFIFAGAAASWSFG